MDLFLGISIAVLLLLIPTLDFLRTRIEENKKKQKSVKNLITIRKWSYAIAWLLFLFTVIREIHTASEKKETAETVKHTSDRDSVNFDTLKGTTKRLPFKIDSSTDEVKKAINGSKDSIIREVHRRNKPLNPVVLKADIDLSTPYTGYTNPFILVSHDTTLVNIGLSNYGNSTAKNMKDLKIVSGWEGNRKVFIIPYYPSTNRTLNLRPFKQEKEEVPLVFTYYVPVKMEKYFFTFKLNYTNESSKNPDSIFKIFYVDHQLIRESNSYEFDSIYNLLKGKNLLN
jgi:hypothetical protein